MTKKQLAQLLYKVAYLKGKFTLRSGVISNYYFDKYQFESDPKILRHLVGCLKELIPKKAEVLAGIELGGIPLSTALSLELNIPQVLVRKNRKEYGTENIAEGANIKNKKICIIEDVVSTGGQVIESVQELRKSGGNVLWVVYVVSRDDKSKIILKNNGLIPISLFDIDEILQASN